MSLLLCFPMSFCLYKWKDNMLTLRESNWEWDSEQWRFKKTAEFLNYQYGGWEGWPEKCTMIAEQY